MPPHSAIGVHNNFSPRQPSIPLRPSNHKFTSWINQILRILRQHPLRQNRLDHFLNTELLNLRVLRRRGVLRRNNHIRDPHRLVVNILHRDL